jgi:peptidoglycan/LPS O-acetylase OafA/YrhL
MSCGPLGPTALALLAGVFIGSLVLWPAGSASRILSHLWLANPRRDLSYAAYLWHLPIYLLLIPLVRALWMRVPAAALLTMLMAYLSFRFVERPLRRCTFKRLEPAVVRPVPELARELEPLGRLSRPAGTSYPLLLTMGTSRLGTGCVPAMPSVRAIKKQVLRTGPCK